MEVVAQHEIGKAVACLDQPIGCLGYHHPSGKPPSTPNLTVLAGCNQVHQTGLVGAQAWTARMVVLDLAAGMELQFTDKLGQVGQGGRAVRLIHACLELMPNEVPVRTVVLGQSEHPMAERPDKKAFAMNQFRHELRPTCLNIVFWHGLHVFFPQFLYGFRITILRIIRIRNTCRSSEMG